MYCDETARVRIADLVAIATTGWLDADMVGRPLSGDLEAVRQLLFDDTLWMGAEGVD